MYQHLRWPWRWSGGCWSILFRWARDLREMEAKVLCFPPWSPVAEARGEAPGRAVSPISVERVTATAPFAVDDWDGDIDTSQPKGWKRRRVEDFSEPWCSGGYKDPRDDRRIFRMLQSAADISEGSGGPSTPDGGGGEWVIGMVSEYLRRNRYAAGEGATGPAWNLWLEFCNRQGAGPFRPVTGEVEARISEGKRLQDFVIWMVCVRGYAVGTAKQYLSRLQGFHFDQVGHRISEGVGESMPGTALKRMLRLAPPESKPRDPISRDMLLAWLGVRGTGGAGMMERAAAAFAWSALARGGEVAAGAGGVESSEAPPRLRHVRMERDEGGEVKMVVVSLFPLKKGGGASAGSGADGEGRLDIYLPYSATERFNAAREVAGLVRRRRQEGAGEGDWLFAWDGKALTRGGLESVAERIATNSGKDGKRFGCHSFRVGGATEAARKGVSMLELMQLGRWASDCAAIYARYDRRTGADLVWRLGKDD